MLGPRTRSGGTTTISTTCSTLTGSWSKQPGRRLTSGLQRTAEAAETVPDAHDPSKRHAPMMATTDIALKVDPAYSRRCPSSFHEHPGRVRRRVRPRLVQADSPRHGATLALSWKAGAAARILIWQDPVPDVDHALVESNDSCPLEGEDFSVRGSRSSELVSTAWASAATLPRVRQARRRQRRAHPPLAAEGLGREPACAARKGISRPGKHSGTSSTRARLRARRSRSPTSSCSPAARPIEAAAKKGRSRRGRSRSRRAGPTRHRSTPTCSRSPFSSRPPTGSATISAAPMTGSRPEELLVDKAQL